MLNKESYKRLRHVLKGKVVRLHAELVLWVTGGIAPTLS
jgi:hypothetical protein